MFGQNNSPTFMDTLENLDDILNVVKEKVKELIHNSYCEVNKIPQKQGVYLIYNNNEAIYVGKTKKLNSRINKKHISGSATNKTSAF